MYFTFDKRHKKKSFNNIDLLFMMSYSTSNRLIEKYYGNQLTSPVIKLSKIN